MKCLINLCTINFVINYEILANILVQYFCKKLDIDKKSINIL